MTPIEIVTALAKADPVFDTSRPRDPLELALAEQKAIPPEQARRVDAVRRCACCRRESGHNEETVSHAPDCPWIHARRFARSLSEVQG